MASHGVHRPTSTENKSEKTREREQADIAKYQELVDLVNAKIKERQYTLEVLGRTSELLKRNPEYYTIWNHRRRILQHHFILPGGDDSTSNVATQDHSDSNFKLISADLKFLLPLLIEFPKCYWIWNYRLWLLQNATKLLSASIAVRLWQEELGLVGKMLSRDSRNFMGWGYRRTVVASLEKMTGTSMAQDELDYTTKMIKTNLSNFSAWHNRTKLMQRMLDEQAATDGDRRRRLDEELKLVHRALLDPYDQSLWSYYHNLMCTFDPTMAAETLAPNLSKSERLQYLEAEHEFLEEILDGAEDCKLIYQALIECAVLSMKVKGPGKDDPQNDIKVWLAELKKLDPLRLGRWDELETSLHKHPKR